MPRGFESLGHGKMVVRVIGGYRVLVLFKDRMTCQWKELCDVRLKRSAHLWKSVELRPTHHT